MLANDYKHIKAICQLVFAGISGPAESGYNIAQVQNM